jgi:hypothetical protein
MRGSGERLTPAHDGPLPVFQAPDLRRAILALQKAAKSKVGSGAQLTEEEQRDVASLPLLPGNIIAIDMGGRIVQSVVISAPRHRDHKATDDPNPETYKRLDPGDDVEVEVEFQHGSRSNYRLWALGIVEVRGRRSPNTTTIYQKS